MSGDLAAFKARLPIVEIVARYVRLTRNGPLWKGLCPFHQEKTPSFTVTESRGTYHCFGCGAHGNGIDFVMAMEGLDFAPAVRRAAELTGLEPPVTDRPDPARVRALGLTEVLEAAARFYRGALARPEGKAAAAYAARRGLDSATLQAFELGYAPAGRATLTQALHAKGVPLADLVEAGLTIVPDDGGAALDRFRDRLMFPIRDDHGRLVGFGGRALKDNAAAKYLNSPEGPLFKKREMLYGAHRLDRRAGRGRVHVAEGYLDVIAMARCGLAAVAPLGTAVTSEQIERLWRLDDAPLVCLDGDAAGLRAAGKLAETALGLLRPGHTLRFIVLPPGEDPDSLLAAGGVERWRELTASPMPLAGMLWRHLGGDPPPCGPDARAALRRRLKEVLGSVRDPDIRREYGDDLFARLRAGGASASPRPSTTRRAVTSHRSSASNDEACVLLAVMEDPGLLPHALAFLEKPGFTSAHAAHLSEAILDHGENEADPSSIKARLDADATAGDALAWLEQRRRHFTWSGQAIRETALRVLGIAGDAAATDGLADLEAEVARIRDTYVKKPQ